MKTTLSHSEVLHTFKAAQVHGGSFIRALATAGLKADSDNISKILCTWPELKATYGPGSPFYDKTGA